MNNQTLVVVALSALAVVSAILSFVAWSLLVRPPASPLEEAPNDGRGEEAPGDETPAASPDGEATGDDAGAPAT